MNLPDVKHTNTLPKKEIHLCYFSAKKGQWTVGKSCLELPTFTCQGASRCHTFSSEHVQWKKIKQPNLETLGEYNNGRRAKIKQSPQCFHWIVWLDTIRTCCSKYLKSPARESPSGLKNVSLPPRKKIPINISALLAHLGKSCNIKIKNKKYFNSVFSPHKKKPLFLPSILTKCMCSSKRSIPWNSWDCS